MKKGFVILLPLCAFLIGCGGAMRSGRSPKPPEEPYPVLNPYGTWMDISGLGHVWRPRVEAGWRPFTVGEWTWTDRGWLWHSDEPFAWVVYHYGWWAHRPAEGWVWIPGYEWSPARVQWYTEDNFVCWAPESPPNVHAAMMFDPGYEDTWVGVPATRFADPHAGMYRSYPPAGSMMGGRVHERERPPDIESVQRHANRTIGIRRTETEEVRQGGRTISRVRLETSEPTQPLSPARENPNPPALAPAVRPVPSGNPPAANDRSQPAPPRPAVRPAPSKNPPEPKEEVRPVPQRPAVRPAPSKRTPSPAVTPGRKAPTPLPAAVPSGPLKNETKKVEPNREKVKAPPSEPRVPEQRRTPVGVDSTKTPRQNPNIPQQPESQRQGRKR
jgi:hypothetical protein